MGYTHYFHYHHASISLKDWTTLTNAVNLLIKNLPEHSTSGGGYHADDVLKLDADTVVSRDQIAFNGDGALAHETFVLNRSWRKELKAQKQEAIENGRHPTAQYFEVKLRAHGYVEFCKTERKPYDLLVCAVLALAHHLYPDWITVTSDGCASEWSDAVAWAAKVTDYGIEVPPGIHVENGTVHIDGAVQVQEGSTK